MQQQIIYKNLMNRLKSKKRLCRSWFFQITSRRMCRSTMSILNKLCVHLPFLEKFIWRLKSMDLILSLSLSKSFHSFQVYLISAAKKREVEKLWNQKFGNNRSQPKLFINNTKLVCLSHSTRANREILFIIIFKL